MNYLKIRADQVWGHEIGQLYANASPFITGLARFAYQRFAMEVDRQFHAVVAAYSIDVRFVKEDPYGSAAEMAEDVRAHRRLEIYSTTEDQRHPLLSLDQNNRFRAVHDFFGHSGYPSGPVLSFSRDGEEAAWVRHAQMFTGLARRAMTTETRGQNSAFIWVNEGREFPEQKAVLLPDWVSDIPHRYLSLV